MDQGWPDQITSTIVLQNIIQFKTSLLTGLEEDFETLENIKVLNCWWLDTMDTSGSNCLQTSNTNRLRCGTRQCRASHSWNWSMRNHTKSSRNTQTWKCWFVRLRGSRCSPKTIFARSTRCCGGPRTKSARMLHDRRRNKAFKDTLNCLFPCGIRQCLMNLGILLTYPKRIVCSIS